MAAESLHHPFREIQFGMDAMDKAEDTSIFSKPQVHTAIAGIALTADTEDVLHFWEWNRLLKSITRNKEKEKGHGTEDRHNELTNSLDISNGEVDPGGDMNLPHKQPKDRPQLQLLNKEQKRVHDIVESHLKALLAGRNPKLLHMMVQGQGGTGKTILINAISETFEYHNAEEILAKTVTSGVAASLIGGQTIYSFGAIPINPGKKDDWYDKGSKETKEKRQQNIAGKEYLEVDECSMMTKDMLVLVSEVLSREKSWQGGHWEQLFGGMSVILYGNFHQFLPVGNPSAALYDSRTKGECAEIGRELYQLFTNVVILMKQNRVWNEGWIALLNCLCIGGCTADDLRELDKLVIDKTEELDFTAAPWKDTIFVTSQHGPRDRWNDEALC